MRSMSASPEAPRSGVGARHRGFEQQRFPRLDRGNRHAVVQAWRRGDDDRFDLGMVDQRTGIGGDMRHEMLGGDKMGVFRLERADSDQRGFLQLLQGWNMHIRAEAESDHTDAHRRRITRAQPLGGD